MNVTVADLSIYNSFFLYEIYRYNYSLIHVCLICTGVIRYALFACTLKAHPKRADATDFYKYANN